MLSQLRRKGVLLLIAGAVIGLLIWFWQRPDPRARFLADVEKILALANEGRHIQVLDKLSPEARQRITEDFMEPAAALRWAARLDTQQRRVYRVVNLSVFYPRDYAEVEIERSGPNAEFSGHNIFPVPFIWRQGQWWIAGSFREPRPWHYPE